MGLVNLRALSSSGWDNLWWYNWNDHWEIQQAVQAKTGINNELYQIYPWTEKDSEGNLERHQQYHNDMNAALGLAGQDLTVIDFKDPISVQNWIFQHYQEHQQARAALGM